MKELALNLRDSLPARQKWRERERWREGELEAVERGGVADGAEGDLREREGATGPA